MSAIQIVCAVAVPLLWGYQFVAIKVGVTEFPPLFFLALRFLAIALLLVPFVKRPTRQQLGPVAAISLFLGGLNFGLFCGLFGMLFGGLRAGGEACLRHLVLRLWLIRNGSTPWNYVRFLDHAAERILLRKVGGGYVFIHRMLLDYFAARYVEPGAAAAKLAISSSPEAES